MEIAGRADTVHHRRSGDFLAGDWDPDPLADGAEHGGSTLHIRRVEDAQALIGEQQLGLGRQRAGELELLERGGAEAIGAGRRIAGQADLVERHGGAALRLAPRDTAAGAVERGEGDMVEQGQLGERARDLEGARYAAAPDEVRGLPRGLSRGKNDDTPDLPVR